MHRVLALVLVVVAAALPLGGAATARADGDPASDTLLYSDSFYPYRPNLVSKPLQQALDSMLAKAKKQGFALKVAIIAAETDLGSVPQLFTQPQKYADLLTSEISFNAKPRLLVVLPSGLGGNNLGDKAGPALSGITPPAGGDGDGLTRTAMQAVAALAKANGTPVALPQVQSAPKRDSGGTSPLLTFGLPVLLVVLAAGAAAARGRAREDEGEGARKADDEQTDTDADDETPASVDS